MLMNNQTKETMIFAWERAHPVGWMQEDVSCLCWNAAGAITWFWRCLVAIGGLRKVAWWFVDKLLLGYSLELFKKEIVEVLSDIQARSMYALSQRLFFEESRFACQRVDCIERRGEQWNFCSCSFVLLVNVWLVSIVLIEYSFIVVLIRYW